MTPQKHTLSPTVELWLGDCRDVMPGLAPVQLCIVDPPYQSLDVEVSRGTTTRLVGRDQLAGKRLASKERGQWFQTIPDAELQQLLGLCRERLLDTGAIYCFADIKSGLKLFPQLHPANVLTWNKGQIGMGYSWRRMTEWIAYVPRPNHELRDAGAGDCITVNGVATKTHPTEKPLGIYAPLILNSSDLGDTVLDPFCGSGSALVAAVRCGRRAIGIELDPKHFATARRRLEAELAQGVLPLEAPHRPKQGTLEVKP